MAKYSDDQHPATATLLDYLDNCCSDEDSSHIQQCVLCLNEVVQISESRSQLQQLPQVQAPAHLWSNIQHEIQPPQAAVKKTQNWPYQWFATAASIVIVATLFILNPVQKSETLLQPETNPEYLSLLQESQQLESTLAYLDRQPTIINLSTVGKISQYRDSIATIDVALNDYDKTGEDQTFKITLMKERVHLMRQLVKQKAKPLMTTYRTF
ncbi:MAG: hypothetical protein GY744_15220 [Gammaproteobacteria bacterium]|nr:hypothetical protein [Gammaproteobacteria bacterium]